MMIVTIDITLVAKNFNSNPIIDLFLDSFDKYTSFALPDSHNGIC
jgi:hypothetical protein